MTENVGKVAVKKSTRFSRVDYFAKPLHLPTPATKSVKNNGVSV